MRLISTTYHLLVLCLFLSTPLILTGDLLFGLSGALAGLCISTVGLLSLSLSAERGVQKCLSPIYVPPSHLKRSLDQILMALGKEHNIVLRPKITFFQDPIPHALIAKSLFSRGQIYLSQGLVFCLSEEELSEVLRQGLFRLRRTDAHFLSLCTRVLHFCWKSLPKSGISLIQSTKFAPPTRTPPLYPWTAVQFLLFWWIFRLISNLAKKASHHETEGSSSPLSHPKRDQQPQGLRRALPNAQPLNHEFTHLLCLFPPATADSSVDSTSTLCKNKIEK